MKTWKAICTGALVWVLIFIEWSIMIFTPGLKDMATLQFIIHYFLLIFIGSLGAFIYYKSKDKINGFALGAVFLLVGIILDAIITVPLFIIPQGMSYADFFFNPLLFVGFVELIVVVGLYKIIKK